MKVKYLFKIAALLLVAALSSCSSDDFTEVVVEPETTPQGTIPFTTTIGKKSDGTRALADYENGVITAFWADGETVGDKADEVAIIFNNKKVGTATVTEVLEDGTAIIEGSVTGVSDADNVKLLYPANAAAKMDATTGEIPDSYYEGQDGTLEDIAENYAVAISDEAAISITDGVASLTKRVHLYNQNAICKFRFRENPNNQSEAYMKMNKFVLSTGTDKVLNFLTFANPTDVVYIAMKPQEGTPTLQYRITANDKTDFYIGSAKAYVEAGDFYDLNYLTLEKVTDSRTVDLGLSVNWASMNVGATSTTDISKYFAWGGIIGYSYNNRGDRHSFTIGNAPYYDSESSAYTKYTADDGKTTLELIDDAARVNWGKPWRMPTGDEMQELLDNTTYTYVSDYNGSGAAGMEFTSTVEGFTDQKIFLPADGAYMGPSLSFPGSGHYWSSSLDTSYPLYGWNLRFDNSGSAGMNNNYVSLRYNGFTVRAVW